MKGFLLVDKEKGLTSFDVIRGVRRAVDMKKVGHSGTLDPLATGLLLVAIGEGTKLLEFLIGCDKEYEVVGRFGSVSDTYDAEGVIVEEDLSLKFVKEDLLKMIDENFLGRIEQIPPKYSALKVDGKKAYELARAGKEVHLKGREVRIDEFEIVKFEWPVVSFRVKCGSGTYIRSLIHDLGQLLGCGGYVEELRRTIVGNFVIEKAVKLSGLGNKSDQSFDQKIVSMEEVGKMFDFWDLDDEEWEGLQDGRVLLDKKIDHGRPMMAFYRDELVGVLKNATDGGVRFRKMIL